MNVFSLVWLIATGLAITTAQDQCQNMWEITNFLGADVCDVPTDGPNMCAFPFEHNGKSYSHCVINSPLADSVPACKDQSGEWHKCIVPTDAVILGVTTRKADDFTVKGASYKGGTLVWISGIRFAEESFSTSPSSSTNNVVYFANEFSSYPCELHPDATTTSQITCYTPEMPIGTYSVLIQIKGDFVPFYQYRNVDDAKIEITDSNTPKINGITPFMGPPGTFVDVTGNFRTNCYLRDSEGCADDSGARISRLYIGGSQCQLINATSSELYEEVTSTKAHCKIEKPEVGYFRASMLVSNQYGRAATSRNIFYVSPDENIYNFQSYAEIDSISPQTGSMEGGTHVTITGKYLYHDSNVPAKIDIAGSPCNVIDFDMSDLLATRIVCESAPGVSAPTDNYGNRGITLITDNVLVNAADFATAVPTGNAIERIISQAKVEDEGSSGDNTVWMKGFLYPRVNSSYEFKIWTNGQAKLFISTDATEANKVEVAQNGLVDLLEDTYYYFLAVGSKAGSKLNLQINAKMMQTSLTDAESNFVKNEIQEIDISSTKIPEAYTLTLSPNVTLNETDLSGVVQTVLIQSLGANAPFSFSLYGTETANIAFGATAEEVAAALNDLPFLYPNMANVSESLMGGNSSAKNYTVTFNGNLGDVPLLIEVNGYVNSTITKVAQVSGSGSKSHIMIDNVPTYLFNAYEDNEDEIKEVLEKSFGIRCPNSIQMDVQGDTFRTFDYEDCQWGDSMVNETAFCGKCAKTDLNDIFTNLNVSLSYNYFCAAYKLSQQVSYLKLKIVDPLFKTLNDYNIQIEPTIDNQWHYECWNIKQLWEEANPSSSYSASNIQVFSLSMYPTVGMVDAVSFRKTLPVGIAINGVEDMDKMKARRVFPTIQYQAESLTVNKTDGSVDFSFRPTNCTFNLNLFTLMNSYTTDAPTMAQSTAASPPVTGNFGLSWDGNTLSNIASNIDESELTALFQSIPSFGNAQVTRSKDCSGYKWTVKWLSGGDKPALSIASNNLLGSSVALAVNGVEDGGAVFQPIQADFLRTYHSQPQVAVSINGIPTACSNCTFAWSADATPVVNTIDATSNNAITIDGTGFSETATDNIVLIGSIRCTVTSATATRLVCTAGLNPVGSYPFSVNVLGKGLATMNSNTEATFSLTTTALSPISGSTGGGNLLQINGTGFSPQSTVTVDGNQCRITQVTYFAISCIVPPSDTASNKQVDVVVVDSTSSTLTAAYLYDFESTPVISTIEPNVLSVEGGQVVVMTGTNLPVVSSNVKFGEIDVSIISSNETTLVVRSPAVEPGLYDLNLILESAGSARVLQKIEYRLYVTSFTPNVGSIRGGSVISVYGEGFDSANCAHNMVSFGNQRCQVTNCSSSWIQCKASSAFVTHQLSNEGADPLHGKGYAWSTPFLTIKVGDSVNWSWKPPTGINSVKYQVMQVQDALAKDPIGFESGDATAKGSFLHQFNQAGTYHYWSGFVESTNIISFRGTIEVVNSVDKQLNLNVKLNGYSAQKCVFPFTYLGTEYTACTNEGETFSWCSPSANFTGQKLKCDPQETAPVPDCPGSNVDAIACGVTAPTDLYSMLFTNCQGNMAIISSVSVTESTYDADIVIAGSGFSATQCENRVMIGPVACVLTASSSTELTCRIPADSGLYPNYPYPVEVLVANKGYALADETFEMKFLPKVDSFTPNTGSVAGGTRILIQGDGFIPQATVVRIGQHPFYVGNHARINGSTIEIDTVFPPDTTGQFNVNVTVNNVPAVCSGDCTFDVSEAISPVLSAVSPSSINDTSDILLEGSMFGTDAANVRVTIGNEDCQVQEVSATNIRCSVAGIQAGDQRVNVNVRGVGNAKSSANLAVTGVLNVKAVVPNTGSVHGGQLIQVQGNGFDMNTQVTIGAFPCSVEQATASSLSCRTSDSTQAPMNTGVRRRRSTVEGTITLNSGGVELNSVTAFTYSDAATPTLSSVSPSEGVGGTVTLTGTGFGNDLSMVRVKVGMAACNLTTVTDTEIVCELGANSAGSHAIVVERLDQGNSNSNIEYTYSLTVSALSANEGSIGGGLRLVLTGSGFSMETSVTICNKPCRRLESTFVSFTCEVPKANEENQDSTCTVSVAENSMTAQSSFTYRLSLTPRLTSVSPLRGGTGGGTLLTIVGTGFPTDQNLMQVTIGGSICIVASVSETQITCHTEPYRFSSAILPVNVDITGSGLAFNDGTVVFEYIDLWSSKYTWGGYAPPGEGEIAVISHGQHIYFDAASTPVLKGLIIQGGSLIFDDNQDVALNVEYVIILSGGKFQVGTEEAPFTHKAVITMHGHVRSIELPTYGAKVIALRNGTLDMHGMNVGVTWTKLGETAAVGATEITLQEPVIWPVGSEIVIATTGDNLSPGESELRYIISKSNGDKTLTLDRPLQYGHLGEDRIVGSNGDFQTVSVRAEVGLMTRNVLFQGFNDASWNRLKESEGCQPGFEPSEFATQTCFLGRYGPEMGSDEFGGIIFIFAGQNQPRNVETVVARFSNIELYHVGQAFKKGRYPIHFHMNGDMRSSYVKECAIHESFNRAINIHASNYLRLTRNVIYNIMGGAYFLEDGVEIGNEFMYNLAVFVRTSSSLLNEDVTPAAFWATNPNNTYLHNAVAGSTHFGWWYRLLEHSEGPSFRSDYCPRNMPFGRHFNNSVHSTGRFGIWVFPSYTPTVSGGCNEWTPSAARFQKFESWSNDKGAEFVNSNNIQFVDFKIWDQHDTGIDVKIIKYNSAINTYQRWRFDNEEISSMIRDTVIIGNSIQGQNSHAARGFTWAWDRGEIVKNIKFYNFPTATAMDTTSIDGTCGFKCGGWTNKVSGLTFNNVQYKHSNRWRWDNILYDQDGSLTGQAGDYVVYPDEFMTGDPRCRAMPDFHNAVACSNMETPLRFAFNKFSPDAALIFNISNEAGKMISTDKLKKRLTHKQGMMATIEAKHEYTMFFENAERPTNISYKGAFYGLMPGDWVIVKHPLKKKPDQVYINGNLMSESASPLSYSVNSLGDWYWQNSTYNLAIILKNVDTLPFLDVEFKLEAIRCRFVGCKPPESPADRAPIAARPDNAVFWSDRATWGASSFISRRRRSAATGIPEDGDSILIPDGVYVVVDTPLPKFNILKIEGYLELDDSMDHDLYAEMIFINGGQLIIGWENNPILTNVNIYLTGQKNGINFVLPNGLEKIGGKGIGVYGGLDIHGKPRDVTWTKLTTTANAGSNTVTLMHAVDWVAGEQIVITTTSFIVEHTETMVISAVSDDKRTLTLTAPLAFDHLAFSESFPDGTGYQVAAAVGLLTRNVKVIGVSYENQQADLYGSRIIVSDYSALVNDFPTYYKGFARIENCEFYHFGQFSRDAGDDIKFGILLSNLGTYNATRPSYVRRNAFHHGLGIAVGIFSSIGFPIENNVIHRTIDYAIRFTGKENIARGNLLAMHHWGSSYVTKEAPLDKTYWGAIDISHADSAIVEDNFLAGVERVGINMRGDTCEGESLPGNLAHSVKNNTIHGAGNAVALLPYYTFTSQSCLRLRGFTIYKSQYFGLYYQSGTEVVLEDNVVIDAQIGVLTLLTGPSPVSHVNANKKVIIQDSIIVASSLMADCDNDIYPRNLSDRNQLFGLFGSGPNQKGRIGIVFPTLMIGSNGLEKGVHPHAGVMSYPQIGGQQIVTNVTFANFNTNCGNRQDSVIVTAKFNDDGQHPVKLANIHLHNVTNSSKVWFHRPNVGKINPSDCVDMDCDGLKKNLIRDTDGSFLGAPGAVISQSEYEWGSQQRGLGDFRIPKEMLSYPNGSLIDPSEVYEHPGIVRDEDLCSYQADWQAYQCFGLDYRMLIIENMDWDTEVRRLSPIAILSDNGYLDLINGPQDHGWCFGYTCQKRVSTFMALIAADKSYDIVLTSTPPETLRMTILNADETFKVRLSMHYSVQQRIDVYKNNIFVDPTNAQYVDGKMTITNPEPLVDFMPTYQSDAGTNLFLKNQQKIYFAIDGSTPIDLKIAPVLFVSFGLPAITPDEFFNEATLVGNFALLLGVDASKIRRVEIVRASRRRRDTESLNFVKITIEENAADPTDTNAVAAQKEAFNALDATISNLFVTNQLQQNAQALLNVTIASLAVQAPSSNTTAQPIPSRADIVVVKPASGCSAQIPCTTQPLLKIVDQNGELITKMGNEAFPWVVVANMTSSSNPAAQLIFETEVNVIDGYATFTQLGISELSTFSLSFKFKSPQGINESQFDPMEQNTPPVTATLPVLSCAQYESDTTVAPNTNFNMTVKIVDQVSKLQVQNISWANYRWTARLNLHELGYHKASGALVATNATVSFDPTNGLAVFQNLQISANGMYLVTFNVFTPDNTEYNFNCFSNAITVETAIESYDSSLPPNYVLKYEGDYNAIEPNEVKANVYNFMSGYNISLAGVTVYSGSVYISFYSSGSSSSLIDTLVAAGLTVDPNLQFSYASINDYIVNCTNCVITATTTTTAAPGIPQETVVAIAVGSVVGGIFGGIIAVGLVVVGFLGCKEFKRIKVKRTNVTPEGIHVEPSKPKSKIEKLLENLTGTTEHNYQSKVKSPNVYDKSYLNEPNQDSPMPVLPRHQTLEEYNQARIASVNSAHSKNFQNFV